MHDTINIYSRRVTFEKSCLLFTENHGKPPQKCTGSDAEQIILKISCKKFLKHFEIYGVSHVFPQSIQITQSDRICGWESSRR